MNSKRTLRQVAVTLLLLVAFLFQGTWALAGTTGGLRGQVSDEKGAPVAGAAVKVLAASGLATATTDASGRFTILNLAPDTYTVSIEKDGYDPLSDAGITVFADNVDTLSFTMHPALKTIAKVTSTSAGSIVKSGVTSDIYNVTATAITKTAALGGGGNLNSAYSAIASVPGVVVPIGGMGWNNNAVYVRGSQSFFTGFEYDGIPVNRAFDNYNSSTESNLGLQELQVYTGGGPASNSSAGTSGFVNQVIKTGTYPGSGSISAGIGTPSFYHQAKVEAGGSTPDRRFSYYVGISGYDQAFRILDNNNGASLMNPGGIYALNSTAPASGFGPAPFCNANAEAASNYTTPLSPMFNGGTPPAWEGSQGCIYPMAAGYYGNPAMITDREDVANFHFAIPHANGLRDDLQLLWSASSMDTAYYSGIADGGGLGPYTLGVTASPYCSAQLTDLNGNACAAPNYPSYDDAVVYNAPFGTPISTISPTNYYQPSSPTNREASAQLPANNRDTIWNDTGVVKLQYTHELSSNAYLRAFAYTFFSDWTQAGADNSWATYTYGIGGPSDSVAANYDLITHTAGGELQLADQINEKHLIQLTGNYTTASVVRFNNSGFTGGTSPVGLISQSNGTFTCYDTTGAPVPCSSAAQSSAAAVAQNGVPSVPAGSAAASAGAQWVTLWQGDASGALNTVKPHFAFISLEDEWRPSDRFMITPSLRFESYQYGLTPSDTLATEFYAQIVANDECTNAAGTLLANPLKPGQPPPPKTIYTATCPSGYSHPAFTAASPSSYTLRYLSPRISATYTESPDTVWRGSIGRFTEPPISASLQYLGASGNGLSLWSGSLPFGFLSPFHDVPGQSAMQADMSLERHIRGTDVSFKVTPFFNYTTGYQVQSFLGPNFVTQVPVGNFRSMGAEFGITKGDFARDGLSGSFSLTYTDAKVQYQPFRGFSQLDNIHSAIAQYDALTKGGGGAPCYTASTYSGGKLTPGVASNCGGATDIANPYYNSPSIDPYGAFPANGWYNAGSAGLSPIFNPTTTYYDVPWSGSLILNYRKSKFAITPSIQFSEGNSYGGPFDVIGYDPRTCTENSASAGITAVSPNTNPQQCDYLSSHGTLSTAAGNLYIPNPQTGSFATLGAFRNPWILTGNVALSYDLSTRVSVQLTLANLFHTCFGGTKAAWTSVTSPGSNVCGYSANYGLYASNLYEGTSINDTAANGFSIPTWMQQSYVPTPFTQTAGVPPPFNAYFQVDFKV